VVTAPRRSWPRRLAALLFQLSFCVAAARANELLIDQRSLQLNDLLTITLSVDGPFAAVDEVHIPVKNLVIVGEPWVSSEFAWVNGDVTRRKVFRYRARPLAPGPAQVGPVILDAEGGQRETLPAAVLQVMPDRTSGSNDAAVVLRELLETGREPLFVVAEIDKRSAFTGEPVTVTWWLYNGTSVQQWQIVSVPKLADFWVEEQNRNDTPERVYLGDLMVQRVPIRRVTLFPLQSGSLPVGGMTVEASVMRRRRGGPFSMFEGEIVETTFTSAPLTVVAKPLPPGPPVDAVGDLSLACASPIQKRGGPVLLRVVLAGAGNLRAAAAPHFDGPVAGNVQVEGGEVSVSRDDAFSMTRQWRYLIFPAEAGPLTIPALSMRVFVPSTGQRKELRCTPSFLNAIMTRPAEPAPLPPVTPREREARWSWLLGALIAALAAVLAIPPLRRELALRRAVREIVHGATPAEIRARVEARKPIDIREASDRGDAWRALRSLLDAAEKDRDIAIGAEDEIARRVRDVLASG
jgi:hypothetical protein